MALTITTARDAIVTELNATTWQSLTVVATAAYLHQFGLDEADDTFRCTVAPATREVGDRDRGTQEGLLTFDLTFSKRIAPVNTQATDRAAVDALVDAVEKVQDYYSDNHTLSGTTGYRVWEVGALEVYDPLRLDTEDLFVATLAVTVYKDQTL